MATVTGFTKERMLNIENTTVVAGHVTGDNLVLVTRAGDEIVAGNVRGPAGSGGGGSSVVVERTFATASTSWLFQHNLGTKGLTIKTFDSSGKEFEGEITYIDDNNVRVDFYLPQSGIIRVFT